MNRRGWGVLGIIGGLLVIGAVVVVLGAPTGSRAANRVVDSWIEAMAQPSGDRGWSQLSPETRTLVYGGDPERFWNDIAEVDWAAVAWAPAQGRVDDGAFYLGNVWLRSHPSTLPRFLVERGLAVESCTDGVPFGIHLQMSIGWFEPPLVIGQVDKSATPTACGFAFEHPGAAHEPWDIVAAAWASPGEIQRVGVLDSSGLVSTAGAGREEPPLDGPAAVSAFGPRELAVTWRGAACDSNSTIVVSGGSSALRIEIRRGLEGGCSGSDVVYESILTLESEVPPQRVRVEVVGTRR
jgi:hypothetical protein